MKIVFYVPDLTHLRYYMPLALSLKSNDITFFFIKDNVKYNGLSSENNFQKFKELVQGFNITNNVSDINDIDVIVTVESVNDSRFVELRKKAKKHFVFAHGFDCIDHSKKLNDCVYVIPFEESKKIIGNVTYDVRVLDVPVTFLYDFDITIDNKSIFMFYPDAGHSDFCKKLIKTLEEENFLITVKQRKKHQTINDVVCHKKLYDDIWWPSEAISGPINSGVTIGFGSTAYTDLAVAGLRYIDIYNGTIQKFPWNVFEFPKTSNFVKLVDPNVATVIQNVKDLLRVDINLPTMQQKEQQVNKIIAWMQL